MLGFSPIGDLLACGQLDRSLLLWPEAGQGRPWQFSGFLAKLRALAWSDQPGRLAPALAVASGDTVVLWQQRNQSQQGWKPEPRLDQLMPQPVDQLKIAILTRLEAAFLELGNGRLVQLRLRPFGRPGRGLQGGRA